MPLGVAKLSGALRTGGPRSADVSVVVRSMARPSLDAALRSLDAQQGVTLEIVVVAASGPSHPALRGGAGPNVVRLVPSGVPLRRATAANVGLDSASCDLVTFLDDDDAFRPGHVAGLLAALERVPECGVVHSYADAVFGDGRHERFGHPVSVLELYERNAIHLSTALFRRELVARGCRFDESLDIHEDWDFFLQLAQHTRFAFAPVDTFVWHADLGESGAGAGRNQDDARFATVRDRVYAKWAARRTALSERVATCLSDAIGAAQRGDHAAAQQRARAALEADQNNPHALNLLAMLARQAGDLREARVLQSLAVDVRPDDPALVHNLALVALAANDVADAQACCARALRLSPAYAPALKLLERLAKAPRGTPAS